MIYHQAIKFLLILLTLSIRTQINFLNATEQLCVLDCKLPTNDRMVGPTRPWFSTDALGNKLSLTRPYPYAIASQKINVISFNVILRLHMTNVPQQDERKNFIVVPTIIKLLKQVLEKFVSVSIELLKETINVEGETVSKHYENNSLDITLNIKSIVEHNDYNVTTANILFNEITKTITSAVRSGNMTNLLSTHTDHIVDLNDARVDFPFISEESNIRNYTTFSKLGDDNILNPFSKFCELGCSLFFSSSLVPITLTNCFEKCEKTYTFTSTVEYNDLVETAKLECRDGCLIALKRCQPGYYCEQITAKGENNTHYNGGKMWPCSPGTFRNNILQDSLEKCIDCPPGRYRENSKGKNLDSCTKCRE